MGQPGADWRIGYAEAREDEPLHSESTYNGSRPQYRPTTWTGEATVTSQAERAEAEQERQATPASKCSQQWQSGVWLKELNCPGHSDQPE